MSDTTTPTPTGCCRRLGRLAGFGLLAAMVTAVVTALLAALLEAAGIDFLVDGGEIPLAGFASMTFFLSVLGLAVAAVLLRWSARPAERFLAISVTLTAVSLVPPILWGSGAASIAGLIVLHLVAAAVMITALVRILWEV